MEGKRYSLVDRLNRFLLLISGFHRVLQENRVYKRNMRFM